MLPTEEKIPEVKTREVICFRNTDFDYQSIATHPFHFDTECDPSPEALENARVETISLFGGDGFMAFREIQAKLVNGQVSSKLGNGFDHDLFSTLQLTPAVRYIRFRTFSNNCLTAVQLLDCE
jgi:hypothetical protein